MRPGTKHMAAEHFGTSAWTLTGKTTARNQRGEKYYFVKIAFGEAGRKMTQREFESSKLISDTMPTFIPKPYGFGEFSASELTAYFYLSQFVDLDIDIPPDPDEFTQRLAYMHKLGRSPTGKFGFPVPICDGDWPPYCRLA